jgi:hypothetical protein
MQCKVILSILLAITVIGISQNAFAEEGVETYIAIDNEEFVQPDSRYDYQEITIIGHIQEYMRGDNITLTIIYPDESEEELNTYASKKGDMFTLIHITQDSQIGTHMIFLDYGMDIAYTSFEILENVR